MGSYYGLRLTALASPDFDPMVVTGAIFKVTKPGGTTVSWTGTVDTQSSSSVRAVYAFAPTGLDLDMPGTWRVWVQWTVAGGGLGPRTETVTFQVIAADK